MNFFQILLVLPLLLFSVTAENIDECKVDDPEDDYWHEEDCIFPFVSEGKKYNK